jgi:protein-S-isoprenylcysteine O-methyltransferase Ste14
MVLGWVLMVTAQLQMGTSWRIGIDKDQKTTLIAKGLYRFSRNPIYVGMMVILLGILMVLANAVALGAFLVSLVSVPIQVRLEETYLRAMHGEAFEGYCGAVRRWL